MSKRVNSKKHRDQNRFATIPSVGIPRSSFDRSHGLKGTYESGELYPFLVDEGLPGDTFSCSVNSYLRMATLLHPIMDNQSVSYFFFAVPYRLLWEHWVNLMGEEDVPAGGTANTYLIPQIVIPDGLAGGSLYDHMGIPPFVDDPVTFSALPLRAYNLIWNEWFRDENLQQKLPIHIDDGPDPIGDYNIVRRAKVHDYFTSSLPWPSKGPPVSLPLGQSAPVLTDSTQPNFDPLGNPGQNINIIGQENTPSPGEFLHGDTNMLPTPGPIMWGDNTGMFTDLSNATAGTINDLRLAFQLQRLYERDARGGSRYTETNLAHFGVKSPDARLQRPEYIGGGGFMINVNAVAQTGTDDLGENSFLGDLGAFATGTNNGNRWTHSLTEHCIIMGLFSVRADLNYQQGLHRMWSRRERFDHYFPALSHIGEQAVLSQEIYQDGTADDQLVWGYQEAWAEYRYSPSRIVGKFRSVVPQSLDTWHLAQFYATRPFLNDVFIEENPPTDRVIAVPSEPTWLGDFWFDYQVTRPMPTYSVPGLIDHF